MVIVSAATPPRRFTADKFTGHIRNCERRQIVMVWTGGPTANDAVVERQFYFFGIALNVHCHVCAWVCFP
jgi:hypothetical protein